MAGESDERRWSSCSGEKDEKDVDNVDEAFWSKRYTSDEGGKRR